MEGLRPPINLILSGPSENFYGFKRKFLNYIEAAGLTEKSEERKIALFLNLAGDDAMDVYMTSMEELKIKSLEKLLEQFEKHIKPRKNIIANSYKFFNMAQGEGETFEHYVTELKKQAKLCEFKEEDRLVRDMIVIGIKDKGVQERLLRESDLTLDQAMQFGRAAEIGKMQVGALNEKKDIDTIHKQRVNYRKEKKNYRNNCGKCGKIHEPRKCPAFGKKCVLCNNLNHFAVMCRNKNIYRKKKQAYSLEKEENQSVSDSDNNYTIGSLNYIDNIKLQWREKINILGLNIEFKLDTGADCNTLSLKLFKCINKNNKLNLKKTPAILVVYNGERIKTVGQIELSCVVKGINEKICFTIIDLDVQPVIGLPDCIRLNLLKRVDGVQSGKLTEKEKFIKDNKDIFHGLGTIGTYQIKIVDDAQPVVKPIRRIPLAIKDRLKETLNNYENRNIIERVEGPTDWCNNLVIVEKPDKSLRLCLDPKELNKCILRERYLIPSPEEIYNNLAGKKVFTVLDMKDGFFQVMLDDKNKLCTFGTPYGRYRFKRLPFGISSAPEVMQRINTKIFGDIGVEIYYDDIIVAGRNNTEHDDILKKVIERARKYNVKFNKNKIQYKLDHVKYVGLIVSQEGIKVDPDNVKAILELKEPNNVKQLQKFLGMCNYLSKFIPHYSINTEPLRNLLKKDVIWEWSEQQDKAFKDLKTKLSNTPTLAVLNSKGPIVLQTDSSKSGMGACLLQNGKPISFYSRAYTECQTRWAPIEKELFAICIALDKYHQFVYGRNITVETDHKPLVTIINKDINKISARLQRMILKLLKYDINIKYLPGNKMYIADYLSRNYIKNNAEIDPTTQELVHCFETDLAITDSKLKMLQKETVNDADLMQVINWYKSSWPKNNKLIHNKELKIYYSLKEYIHVKDNIVYLQDKIVIPKHIRKEMLMIIHTGHTGIVKCKKRARNVMYWPGMSQDIEKFVLSCNSCEKYRQSNSKEPLMSHDVPSLPFYKIGMDICTYSRKDYLVIVDYYSKWIEVKYLNDKTADSVIKNLLTIFSTHGIPKYIVSDNMPFGSYSFKKFASSLDIQLIHSSPRYPQSNGLSEKAVGIVKNMLKKCENNNDHGFNLALLHYRSTPVAGLDYSPSELLMSRLLRTNLPCTKDHLKPKVVNVQEKMTHNKQKTEFYYNKTSKIRKVNFKPGQSIVMQDRPNRVWRPGKIVKSEGPRSFIIKREDGTEVRRNQKHINYSPNQFIVKSEILDTPLTSLPSQNSNSSENVVNHKISRYGRILKQPSYLKDYTQ